jgi:hypothetical protein
MRLLPGSSDNLQCGCSVILVTLPAQAAIALVHRSCSRARLDCNARAHCSSARPKGSCCCMSGDCSRAFLLCLCRCVVSLLSCVVCVVCCIVLVVLPRCLAQTQEKLLPFCFALKHCSSASLQREYQGRNIRAADVCPLKHRSRVKLKREAQQRNTRAGAAAARGRHLNAWVKSLKGHALRGIAAAAFLY